MKLVKTATFIIGMAVALNIVACAQQSKEEVSKIAKQLNGKDTPETVSEDVGGQPMKIKVSGAAVKSDGGTVTLLDSRITANQTMGKNEKGEVKGEIDEAHKISLERWTQDGLTALSSNETFINLGCPVDESLTKGLTESQAEKADGVLQGQAKLIMICGDLKIPSDLMLLKADHLVLREAKLKGSPLTGLSLSADKVTLVGANTITIKDYMPEEEGKLRRVELNAASKLEGQGTLHISTEGADDDVISDEEQAENTKAEQTIEESKSEEEAPVLNTGAKQEAEANQTSSVQASHK